MAPGNLRSLLMFPVWVLGCRLSFQALAMNCPEDPRCPANPRDAADPPGIAGPCGVADPRGLHHPRGPGGRGGTWASLIRRKVERPGSSLALADLSMPRRLVRRGSDRFLRDTPC
jgi:hypothetical protein